MGDGMMGDSSSGGGMMGGFDAPTAMDTPQETKKVKHRNHCSCFWMLWFHSEIDVPHNFWFPQRGSRICHAEFVCILGLPCAILCVLSSP
jgi:hypothetical protein